MIFRVRALSADAAGVEHFVAWLEESRLTPGLHHHTGRVVADHLDSAGLGHRAARHFVIDRIDCDRAHLNEKIAALRRRPGDLERFVAVLKAREPARIMIAIGDRAANRWHLQFAGRWVVQYNFYLNDERWGRMFMRMCPYLPFSARICLNQHHWLANRMREEGIDLQQCSNAFMRCAKSERLQELADELSHRDLVTCGQKWLASFTPFFTADEREHAGCHHRLFFAQTEFCDNLVFHRRAALDRLGERLLDANRTIGQPNKITTIFGRKISKLQHGKLQTE